MSTTAKAKRRVRSQTSVIHFDVPFHDVDKMGVVWHGNYLKYFKYARTRLFQDTHLGGEISESFPYIWVVIESKVRHTSPLHFEDKIKVEARFVDIDYRIHVAYRVQNLTSGKPAAKGHTMLATLDPHGTMIAQTPAVLYELLTEPTP